MIILDKLKFSHDNKNYDRSYRNNSKKNIFRLLKDVTPVVEAKKEYEGKLIIQSDKIVIIFLRRNNVGQTEELISNMRIRLFLNTLEFCPYAV